ncbi:hypothetical protein DOTSEDRAFT_74523 [Dothistroma septosporum NZE10]|uniref:Uncharacterized protein n=1 Tax=Dothistroma septosporum (strain NZE10 / CBS 128990) TaxID=675120 RepID=N1PI60_DOTSN|nr:hypothetical protein DOTSEDRAFT_74523 [Dothistroma septosporum NZE10]
MRVTVIRREGQKIPGDAPGSTTQAFTVASMRPRPQDVTSGKDGWLMRYNSKQCITPRLHSTTQEH